MDVEAVDREASVWMRQGIALLSSDAAGALDEAVAAFDRAIGLRRQIVDHGHPEYVFGLATGWLNRGDALLRKADAKSLQEAVGAFDRGIALLAAMPWRLDAEARRRLAVGWHNRGLTLHRIGDRFLEARSSFHEALGVLAALEAAAVADRSAIEAAIHTSVASLLVEQLDIASTSGAREAALAALSSIDRARAETDIAVAEIAITARHVLCRAVAAELDVGGAPSPDSVHLVTDAVDEGLALANRWEQKGVDRFRGLAVDLLRFGSRVYAKYQPQFLHEFLNENLDPSQSSIGFAGSAEVRVARLEALWLAFRRGAGG